MAPTCSAPLKYHTDTKLYVAFAHHTETTKRSGLGGIKGDAIPQPSRDFIALHQPRDSSDTLTQPLIRPQWRHIKVCHTDDAGFCFLDGCDKMQRKRVECLSLLLNIPLKKGGIRHFVAVCIGGIFLSDLALLQVTPSYKWPPSCYLQWENTLSISLTAIMGHRR